MSVYLIISYDIADPERYKQYNPGSNHITAQTVAKHGGDIIVATNKAVQLGGAEHDMNVMIRFPNHDAALAWIADSDYAAAKAIRLASTHNICEVLLDALPT